MHLGFDRATYPGDEVMRSLWESTRLSWVAPQLAPAPSSSDAAWMSAVPALRDMGWGLAPLYSGQQSPGGPGSHILTETQGRADAQQAASLVTAAGFEEGSVLYLDIRLGGNLAADHLGYVRSWVSEVRDHTPFGAGVYCSFSGTATQVNAECGDLPTWVFRPLDTGPSTIDLDAEEAPDPASSGWPPALAWQYRMSLAGPVDLAWVDRASGEPRWLAQVDLNAASCRDPSRPAANPVDRASTRPTLGNRASRVGQLA